MGMDRLCKKRISKKKQKHIWEELKQFLSVCQQLTERPQPSEILWLSAWKEQINLSFCLRQGDFKQSSYHFIIFIFSLKKVTKKQPTNIFLWGNNNFPLGKYDSAKNTFPGFTVVVHWNIKEASAHQHSKNTIV